MAMLSIGIAIIIKSITEDFYKSVLFVLTSIAITVMAVRKNKFNQSITDMIILFYRFINNQQTFDYQYKSKLPLALEKENLWQWIL